MSSQKKTDSLGIFIAAALLMLGFVLGYGLHKTTSFFTKQNVDYQQVSSVQTVPAADQGQPVVFSDKSPALADKLSGRVPILMYHYIGEVPPNADRVRRDLTVSTADFTAQMDYLKQSGYQTVTTSDLYNAMNGKKTLPPKPVVVSFDDGYVDTFKYAVPVLKEKGMVGVFAVITQYPGFPAYASWDTIIEAKNSGMEIIPHTRHHIDFHDRRYTEAQRVDEVQGSIQDIKNKLGVNSISFVYPYGHFDSDEEKILKNSGIALAFTTDYGWFQKGVNLLEVPRVRVHGVETIQRFADLLVGNKIN